MTVVDIKYGQRVEGEGIQNIGTVHVSIPDNVDEAVQVYGETLVYGLLTDSIKASAQAIARASESPEAAQAILDNWTPGARKPRVLSEKKKGKLVNAFKNLSPEEAKKILEAAGVSF